MLERSQTWAVVNESIRVGDDSFYVLASVLIDADSRDEMRARLRGLFLPRQRRLHWRDEGGGRRELLASTLGRLGTSVVVVGSGCQPAKQGRARRKCFERLLRHLAGREVNRILVESRDIAGDVQDRILVAALRGNHTIPDRLHVEWTSPIYEPLLWLADIAAGAVLVEQLDSGRYTKLLFDQRSHYRADPQPTEE